MSQEKELYDLIESIEGEFKNVWIDKHKTLKKIPVVVEQVEFMPEQMLQGVIYVSKEFELAEHLCLCGCENHSVTPIDKNGWLLIESENGLTMKPSILNNNCPNKYHYIITNGVANVC